MTHRFAITAFAVALCFISCVIAAAEPLVLTWEPNSEPDIAGYIVYYGLSSREYTVSVDVGDRTSFQLEGNASYQYYFALRAYNRRGQQSEFSAEVSSAD